MAIQGGGGFLIGPSENVAKNLLVAHPKLNVILSTGDQMTHGAQLAVQAEGLSGKVKLIGLGASTYAISAIRSGTWYGSVVTLPLASGALPCRFFTGTFKTRSSHRRLWTLLSSRSKTR